MAVYNAEQIHNGQLVLATVHANVPRPLWPVADLITMMVAFDESSLHIYTNADEPAAEGSSRGIFQQLSAWGSYAARTDPVQSTQMFLRGGAQGQHGLLSIPGWMTMAPQLAAEAVQQSATPGGGNYLAQMGRARDFITQHGSGVLPPVAPGPGAAGPPTNVPVSTDPNNPLPGWAQTVIDPLDVLGNTGKIAGNSSTLIADLGKGVKGLAAATLWLISPAHWLRIAAGMTGFLVVGFALYFIISAT